MNLRTVCCWIVLAALGRPAAAREIYVNNLAGDDRFVGQLPHNTAGAEGPVRTIAKATRLAEPGDLIILAANDEPYRETISLVGLKHSATPAAALVIFGSGATLDGSAAVPTAAWEHVRSGVYRFRPERLAYQRLFLGGLPAVKHPASDWQGSAPRLAPLEWSIAGGYLYFRPETGKTPDAYQPACAGLQTGISLYHVQGVEIRDLVVQGFAVDGIQALDSTDVRLIGVTARGNGRSGIDVSGSSRVEIREALVGDNGAAQLRSEGYSQTHVTGSQLIGNTAPAEQVLGGRLWIDGQRVESGEH